MSEDLIVRVSKQDIELFDHDQVKLIARIPFAFDSHVEDALDNFWHVLRPQLRQTAERVRKERG